MIKIKNYNESEYAKEISQIPLLSNAETMQLIENMQNGNDDAREKLIKHNLRLVLHIANKFKNGNNSPEYLEELISLGSFGLIKGINSYDPTKNIKLSSYCWRCIENEILMSLRKNIRRQTSEVSLEESVFEGKDGDELSLKDLIEDDGISPEENVIQLDRAEKIKFIINKLTKDEQELLFMRFGIFGTQFSQTEIAEMRGISRPHVSRIETKAINKLRHPRLTKVVKSFLEE